LADSGLTVAHMEDRHARLKVKAEITFLGLVADALGDDLLGFHLAHKFDLREIGLVYYVMASSEVLEDALRRVERYSGIVNEGISIQANIGKPVTIRLNYVGVERHSDRQHIEFWLTTIIRICRQLTSRRLIPSRIRIVILDGHVPPLAVAGFAQTLAERDLTLCGYGGRKNADVADHRQCPLLGMGRKRPQRRRTDESSDEFAPPKANAHLPLPVRETYRGRIARSKGAVLTFRRGVLHVCGGHGGNTSPTQLPPTAPGRACASALMSEMGH